VTQRLRIAVLSRNFSVTGGGAERYSIALVEQMAATHEVHVFAQTIDHQFPGVKYHRIPLPLRRPRWINQLYFAWATWRATRKGFDIVHSHENTWHGNVQTVHVLPVTYTLFAGKHGVALALRWLKVLTSPRLLAYLWLEGRRFAFAPHKAIVVTSKTLKDVVVSTFPKSESLFHVITPGVNEVVGQASVDIKQKARRSLNLPVDEKIVLFVGNDMQKKGLPALVKAIALMPLMHLLVVGDGEHSLRMRALADSLCSRTHFVGQLNDMNIAFQAADILVHPTLEDTYGMVVLEAMSHGLPVIVSGKRWCGISAELLSGENAVVLDDPENIDEIELALNRVDNNSTLARNLSDAGIAFATQNTWAKSKKKYLSLFEKGVLHG